MCIYTSRASALDSCYYLRNTNIRASRYVERPDCFVLTVRSVLHVIPGTIEP